MEILRLSAKALTNQWICIPRQRIAYDVYLEDKQEYQQKKSPPHTSILIYLGREPKLFKLAFDDIGTVWRLVN
jgi:hypothetical protein